MMMVWRKSIADAVDKVGENGVIHVENGNGIDTHVDIVSGMRYERGYLSRFFVNQPDKGTFELKIAVFCLWTIHSPAQ